MLAGQPSVAELSGVIVTEINLVRQAGAETLARARCAGYLAGVLLKALELGQIEQRLDALETLLNNKEQAQ